ncbi:MAG: hypothetical protein GEU97_24450 [Actinophytocola sp.]|nr:hypothetical protein [Actinophytocola sp.]
MRDLLYLSESKLRALVPQLPGRIRRRLGIEAGLTVGFASLKAILPGQENHNWVASLDAVIDMIEHERPSRWRTADDVRPGDWIQFDEEFRYGDAWPGSEYDQPVHGLVYFAALERPHFALIGSAAHVLDRRQDAEQPSGPVGYFYMSGLRAYARQLAALPDEAATSEFVAPASSRGGDPHALQRDLAYALKTLWIDVTDDSRSDEWACRASAPVVLHGHARVLEVVHGYSGRPEIVATPLYVEYSPRA